MTSCRVIPTRRKTQPSGDSIGKLLGHVLGSTLLFIALATAAWSVSWVVSMLDAAHHFDADALELLQTVEIWILYLDVLLSGIVLLYGASRFLKELIGLCYA